jgi:hypothetical protein
MRADDTCKSSAHIRAVVERTHAIQMGRGLYSAEMTTRPEALCTGRSRRART